MGPLTIECGIILGNYSHKAISDADEWVADKIYELNMPRKQVSIWVENTFLKLLDEIISNPKAMQKIFSFMFVVNNAIAWKGNYENYTLCRTMNSVIPVPFIKETYVIRDTMYVMTRYDDRQNDVVDKFSFHLRIYPSNDNTFSCWKKVEVEHVLDNSTELFKEELIFNMDMI